MRSKIAASKKWIFVAGIMILMVAALGTQSVFAEGEEEVQQYFGFLSLVPPVLAIALAVITKNIVVSLVTSVFVSATIIAGWNPAGGFTSMIGTYMFAALAEDSNMQALFMMTIIAGFVNLLTKSGGATAFTEMVTSKVRSRATCESGIWLGGLAVWFTDTGNSLIVGPIFEALAEKMRVSREKFSYILDCTTSPICSMIPIIGWGVTTIQYIDIELEAAGMAAETSGMSVFMQAIPFNFYAILTLLMAGFMSMSQWDYGPMLKAQNRAMKTGETIRPGGTPMRSENEQKIDLPEGYKPKISTMAVPLAVLLAVIFIYLTMKGMWTTRVAGSDIRTGIASGFICSTLTLMVICLKEKIFSFEKCVSLFTGGCANAMFMCVVLVLSWSLSNVTKAMGTADYLMEITEGVLAPGLLPCLIFLIGAVMSFATGTSWGTMAILFPIALPLAIGFDVSLPLVSGAVIGGGLFGDHCSPISDTTILASIGAACDHIDHFETQMPYACTVGAVCAVMFLITGWFVTPAMLVVAAAVLIGTIFVLHKLSAKKYGHVKTTDGMGA